MSDWQLIPCLVALREEFNTIAPNRDKASDGSIGDADHSARESDHNPDEDGNVHAIDVDESGPWPDGCTMEKMVQHVIAECRESGESGQDRGRLKYVIYERRIWKASNGWKEEHYSGDNPHDKHVHFSAEYDSQYENDTAPWGLAAKFGDDMPSAQEVAKAVMDYPITLPDGSESTMYKVTRWNLKGTEDAVAKSEGKILAAIDALPTAEEGAAAVVDALGQEDPEALAAALRSVLTPEQTAALKAAL